MENLRTSPRLMVCPPAAAGRQAGLYRGTYSTYILQAHKRRLKSPTFTVLKLDYAWTWEEGSASGTLAYMEQGREVVVAVRPLLGDPQEDVDLQGAGQCAQGGGHKGRAMDAKK